MHRELQEPAGSVRRGRCRPGWGLVREAACVAGAGLALALLANGLSPRGIGLTVDHFRGSPRLGAGGTVAGASNRVETTAVEAPGGGRWERVNRDRVELLFQDPRKAVDRVVFVDARDERQYLEGHLPGAYVLDPYRPVEHLAVVLPVCLTAEQVVVYCRGGDCEDSELAAGILTDAGVSADRILVYAGGLDDWESAGRVMEAGPRLGGQLRGGDVEASGP